MSRQSINTSAILRIARYYGLYSSRTKGMAVKDGSLAKFGYKSNAAEDVKPEGPTDGSKETVSSRASRQSWARLIQKVYEVDPKFFGECQNYTVYVQNAAMKCELNQL